MAAELVHLVNVRTNNKLRLLGVGRGKKKFAYVTQLHLLDFLLPILLPHYLSIKYAESSELFTTKPGKGGDCGVRVSILFQKL